MQRLPCSEVLQRRSPKDGFEKSRIGRHKDISGVLRKWRDVVKDGVSPDSCTAELVVFLQRENARYPKDAEVAPEAVLS